MANGRGVSIAAYASAMRRGLCSVPGLSHGTPSASRNARAASVAASIPTSGRVGARVTGGPHLYRSLLCTLETSAGSVKAMDGTEIGTFAADAERVGALADPVRLALYRFVCAQPEPVSRDHAAEGVGVPRHQARFHLDRLASDGLLETSHARLTGRSGPGAGRPATLYRRAAREIAISLPDREYELAARLLGDAVAESARTGSPVIDAVNGAFAAYGDAAGRAAVVAESDGGRDRHHRPGPGRARLRAAPDATTTSTCTTARSTRSPRCTPSLVCGANRCLVEALADGIAPDRLDARLEPQPDRCCVVLDARPG